MANPFLDLTCIAGCTHSVSPTQRQDAGSENPESFESIVTRVQAAAAEAVETEAGADEIPTTLVVPALTDASTIQDATPDAGVELEDVASDRDTVTSEQSASEPITEATDTSWQPISALASGEKDGTSRAVKYEADDQPVAEAFDVPRRVETSEGSAAEGDRPSGSSAIGSGDVASSVSKDSENAIKPEPNPEADPLLDDASISREDTEAETEIDAAPPTGERDAGEAAGGGNVEEASSVHGFDRDPPKPSESLDVGGEEPVERDGTVAEVANETQRNAAADVAPATQQNESSTGVAALPETVSSATPLTNSDTSTDTGTESPEVRERTAAPSHSVDSNTEKNPGSNDSPVSKVSPDVERDGIETVESDASDAAPSESIGEVVESVESHRASRVGVSPEVAATPVAQSVASGGVDPVARGVVEAPESDSSDDGQAAKTSDQISEEAVEAPTAAADPETSAGRDLPQPTADNSTEVSPSVESSERGIEIPRNESAIPVAIDSTTSVTPTTESSSAIEAMLEPLTLEVFIDENASPESVKKTAEVFRDAMASSLNNEGKTVQIELHPAELGKLKIQVTQVDQSVEAQIIASEWMTSELLNVHREQLVETLSDLGFEASDVEISYEEQRDSGPGRDRRPATLPYKSESASPEQTSHQSTSGGGINIVA